MTFDNSSPDASKIETIQVFIEVEGGSRLRNIYDQQTLELKGARQISLPYPYPYGFILGTHAEDGDNVDCYVITDDPLQHGRTVECLPVGLLEMEEDGQDDRKVLAAPPGQDVALDQALLETLRDFIYGIFAQFPETAVHVGRLLSDQEARRYIRRHQVR
jgi:inorganic pyrophosphatase